MVAMVAAVVTLAVVAIVVVAAAVMMVAAVSAAMRRGSRILWLPRRAVPYGHPPWRGGLVPSE